MSRSVVGLLQHRTEVYGTKDHLPLGPLTLEWIEKMVSEMDCHENTIDVFMSTMHIYNYKLQPFLTLNAYPFLLDQDNIIYID